MFKTSILSAFFIFGIQQNIFAAEISDTSAKSEYKYCDSAENFEKSYIFLKEEKDLELNDLALIKTSIEISKGCNQSFERFKKSYFVMKKSGVDIRKSLDIGLEFSKLSNEQAENFYTIFQKAFLENYFDFDFMTAYKLSLNLSKDVKVNITRVKEDFVGFVGFCLNQKQLGLPIKECAYIAENIIKLSPTFPQTGVFIPFQECYQYLMNHRRIGINLKDSIKLTMKILSYGEKSFPNFKRSFEFALEKIKSPLNEKQAIQMSLEIAENSLQKEQ